ncbi:MAG: transcriptional regulator TetR family [Deltaproteobacteria bacterium]|nr:transcriptional regulator TetR family [Deltaproteobacteria bacterium]
MAERSSKDSTKSRILRAATKLFAEQGYQKTTIVEISREAGFSEAALYEYFQGKEDLLLTIPDVWVIEAIDDLKEQLFGIKGAFNKLRKFFWWYLRYIEKDPATAKVVFLDLKVSRSFVEASVYSNVRTFYSTLLDIFEEGKVSGDLRADLDPHVARSIFLGTIEHIVIRWLLKDMSYSLFENAEQTFDILVNGLRARPGPKANEGDLSA